MNENEALRQAFIGPQRDAIIDEGIDYVDTPVEALGQDPVTPTAVEQDSLMLVRQERGKVNSMLRAAKTNYSVPKGWW